MWGWWRQRQRAIYRYWDGQRTRAIDPLIAWRKMWEHPTCRPQDDFGPATGMNADGTATPFEQEALDRVLSMAREMFDLRQFSETSPGLTIDETLSVLWTFIAFMNALKKKRAPLPTTSPPTESSSSALPGESTMPHSSDSPSTENVSTSDVPSSSSKRSIHL